MSDPYAPPDTEAPRQIQDDLTEVAATLGQTVPWTYLMTALCGLGGLICGLGGIGTLAAFFLGNDTDNHLLFPVVIGFYLVLAVAYAIFTAYLFRFSSSASRFSETRAVPDLLAAAQAQHAFWRAFGILIVLYVISLFVFFLIMLFGALA
jgi:hypothetical protein